MTSPRSAPGSAERRRRRTALTVGACVVVVVISAFAAGVGRFGGDDDAAPSATPTTSTTARRGTTTPAPTSIATGAAAPARARYAPPGADELPHGRDDRHAHGRRHHRAGRATAGGRRHGDR